MKRLLVLALFLALFLVACEQATSPEPPAPIPTALASDGATLYAQDCSSCHGELGEGGIGPALTHIGDHSDEELVEIITNGVPENGMPPWGNRLSAEEILALVGYLRTLGEGGEEVGHVQETPQVVASNVSLDLSISLQAGEVIAQALLKDNAGKGLAGQEVAFNLRTAVGGSLPLGTVTTDAQGVAEFQYDPGEAPSLRLEAVYQPSEESEPVQARAEMEMPGGEEIQPISPGLFSPGPPLPAILILGTVIGGVWLTYAWVGYQLLRIWRGR